MNKKLVILDIVCYAAIPYLIWTHGREPLGDYWAIILSTVPGFIYTVYRFILEKQFNILGLFIISSLLLETTVNLLSSSAGTMLWNQVYLGYGIAGVYLLTILIRKPLGLYFMADYAYLMGHARKDSIALYNRKELFFGFQLLTGLFFIRGLFQTSFKAWLLNKHGVDAYGEILIYLKISSWVFSGMIMIAIVWINIRINKLVHKLYPAAS